MARLRYGMNCSLDGYIKDADGRFDWSEPGEDLHRFFTDSDAEAGTYLYGRRLYETMKVWQEQDWLADAPDFYQDYADVWRRADKVVYSATLEAVSTPRTRLERAFDPAAVRALVDGSDRDVTVGGADLAGQALAAGLVDEVMLVFHPVVVGGGTPALPSGVRLDLRLVEERRFSGGEVSLRYERA